MKPLEKINSLDITDILNKLGIKYQKTITGYDLYENGELTSGRKVKVGDKIFVNDFSNDRGRGEIFSFVMKYLNLPSRETFLWFEKMYGINPNSYSDSAINTL